MEKKRLLSIVSDEKGNEIIQCIVCGEMRPRISNNHEYCEECFLMTSTEMIEEDNDIIVELNRFH